MAENRVSDNKNVLYLIIGVLVVAVGVMGFNLYHAKKQPEGLQINVGPDGLKIQNK
jgi:RsiW-degrading membrane proteinase PrsW (M82 family)